MSGAKDEASPKARAPKSGKGSAVLIRVTNETRAALDAETERTGRSLSQAAEIWLDEARKGRAALAYLAGGADLIPAHEKLGAIAREITDLAGSPDIRSAAIAAGWSWALQFALPAHKSLLDFEIEAAVSRFSAACRKVLDDLCEAPPDDPVLLRAQEGGHISLEGLLAVERRDGPDIMAELSASSEGADGGVSLSNLQYLMAGGSTAGESLREAIAVLKERSDLIKMVRQQRLDAERLGIEVARRLLFNPPKLATAPR